ncbi:hypothetical protein DEA98_25565 [Brucella pseudogrignonensis]|nr:hypothetical protein [Brucella pseudogrignonensis]
MPSDHGAAGHKRVAMPRSIGKKCEGSMLKIIAFLAGLLLVLLPPLARAQTCGGESAANDAASKMLQRQLSALRSIERARGC